MQIFTPPTPLPAHFAQPACFLAGSIDMGSAADWQRQLSESLADAPLVLLNPRRPQWDASWEARWENPIFAEQVSWELEAMERADSIAFYFAPRSQAPITLLELGLWARSGKCVVCCPEGFWRKGNVDAVCVRYGVPQVADLEALADWILAKAHQK